MHVCHTGEPEVAWAILARTEELREEAKKRALDAILRCLPTPQPHPPTHSHTHTCCPSPYPYCMPSPRCKTHYKNHNLKIADGPIGKCMEAILEMKMENTEEHRRILKDAKVWIDQLKSWVTKDPTLRTLWKTQEFDTSPLKHRLGELEKS